MKNPPNKTICNAIMYHIGKITEESKNPAGKKFGRKMLRDSIIMSIGQVSHLDFNVAIQWLIDKNHLKPLGQYTVGIGTGKDIKQYDLNGYTPYTTLSPEQLDAEKTELQKQIASPESMAEATAILTDAFNAKQRELNSETEPKGQNTFRCPADYREINKAGDEVPTFITKEATELQKIEQSLNTLKAKLNGKSIDNLTIKLRTLDELARLLDPEISNVLNQIHQDLKEVAQ